MRFHNLKKNVFFSCFNFFSKVTKIFLKPLRDSIHFLKSCGYTFNAICQKKTKRKRKSISVSESAFWNNLTPPPLREKMIDLSMAWSLIWGFVINLFRLRLIFKRGKCCFWCREIIVKVIIFRKGRSLKIVDFGNVKIEKVWVELDWIIFLSCSF